MEIIDSPKQQQQTEDLQGPRRHTHAYRNQPFQNWHIPWGDHSSPQTGPVFLKVHRPLYFATTLKDSSPKMSPFYPPKGARAETRTMANICLAPGPNAHKDNINSRLKGAVDQELRGEYIQHFPPIFKIVEF